VANRKEIWEVKFLPLTYCQQKSLAFSDGMNADDAYRQFPKTCVRLDHYSLSENQAKRVVLQEQLRVLETRTPACGGKVRLVIFRGGKHIPVKQEALNSVESSSPPVMVNGGSIPLTGLATLVVRATSVSCCTKR
jgi:hypothetical protein